MDWVIFGATVMIIVLEEIIRKRKGQ